MLVCGAALSACHVLAAGFFAMSPSAAGRIDTESVAYAPFSATNGCAEGICRAKPPNGTS